MFSRFQASYQRHGSQRKWPLALTAFALVCVLLVHSIDTCTAHLGAFVDVADAAAATAERCPNEGFDNCSICTSRPDHQSDCCNQFTEIAVLNSAHQAPNPQPDLISAAYFIIPAKPLLIVLTGVMDSRAGPIFAAPLPLYLRSVLPARAPPSLV